MLCVELIPYVTNLCAEATERDFTRTLCKTYTVGYLAFTMFVSTRYRSDYVSL